MIQNELNSQGNRNIKRKLMRHVSKKKKMSEQLKMLKTPTSVFEKYNELTELIETSKNKKQKQYQRITNPYSKQHKLYNRFKTL